VVVDCGTQMNSANAVAVETAEAAVLVTTPDVVAVRAAKRMVRMWDRLQIRKPQDITVAVNRYTRARRSNLADRPHYGDEGRHFRHPGRVQGAPGRR